MFKCCTRCVVVNFSFASQNVSMCIRASVQTLTTRLKPSCAAQMFSPRCHYYHGAQSYFRGMMQTECCSPWFLGQCVENSFSVETLFPPACFMSLLLVDFCWFQNGAVDAVQICASAYTCEILNVLTIRYN